MWLKNRGGILGTIHVVQSGECLSSIAEEYGYRDWRRIWIDPTNTQLREARPNPNLLYPGDEVVLPDKEVGAFDAATGAEHVFEVPRSDVQFCFRIGAPGRFHYRLVVGEGSFAGLVEGGTLVMHPIAGAQRTGQLTVWPEAFASPKEAGARASTWELKLGELDPITTLSGVVARLENLGYSCPPVRSFEDPRFRALVEQFQSRCEGLVIDGVFGPLTRAALEKVYGC